MKSLIFILLFIGSIVMMVLCVNKCCDGLQKSYDDDKQKYESRLGKRILFEKDSVTIIDYSRLDETFTLSNGRKVSFSIVK